MGVFGGGRADSCLEKGMNLHRKELIALPRESAILLLLLLAIAAASFTVPRRQIYVHFFC